MDLSALGSQPMEYKNLNLMFNGMIYNHRELKNNNKYNLIGESDTEVLVNEIYKNGYQYIKGMFALSLYDKKKQTIDLATDLYGQKPLYYFYNNNILFFSSTLLPFIQTDLIDKKIDNNSINNFNLFNFIPSPNTIFENIYKMESNKLLKFQLGDTIKLIQDCEIKKHSFCSKSFLRYNHFIEETHNILKSSIDKHLISDVPISSLQSGGIDSSLINLYLNSQQRIKTFSVIFDNEIHSEKQQITNFTKKNNIDNTMINFSEDSIQNIIDNLHNIFDEPFADSSLINQYLIFNEVSKFTSCCITGDGGDEIFLGYNRHKYFNLYNLLNKFGFSKIVKYLPIEKVLNFYGSRSSLSLNKFEKIVNLIRDNNYKVYENYLTTDHKHDFPIYNNNNINQLSDLISLDKKIYMKDDILVKVDRSSMSNSIESRAPYLYDDISNHLNSYKILNSKFVGKKILKDIASRFFNVRLNSIKKGFTFDLETKFLRNNKFKNLILSTLNSGESEFQYYLSKNFSVIKNQFIKGNNRYNYQIWNQFVLINWMKKNSSYINF